MQMAVSAMWGSFGAHFIGQGYTDAVDRVKVVLSRLLATDTASVLAKRLTEQRAIRRWILAMWLKVRRHNADNPGR
jgi:hypothetical protein